MLAYLKTLAIDIDLCLSYILLLLLRSIDISGREVSVAAPLLLGCATALARLAPLHSLAGVYIVGRLQLSAVSQLLSLSSNICADLLYYSILKLI